jgi:hypothetical protein
MINKVKNISNAEKILAAIVFLFFSLAICYGYFKEQKINEDGVYVLAKIYKINDTENGLNYTFTYYFDNKFYDAGIKGFLKLKDSLILLKISKSNPTLFITIDEKIPYCILTNDSIKVIWKELPWCVK